jgi:hypothetical protein
LRSKSVFASKELYISGLNLLLQLTAYQAYTNISRPHACPKQLKWQYKLYYDSVRYLECYAYTHAYCLGETSFGIYD